MGNEKVVIIGMGFIATFLMPCYQRLLGENISTNAIGIKGSEKGLAEKQAECLFPVIVGHVKETLEERRPDIIVLAVRPHQIAEMTEKTLKPYYDMLRAQGEELPDLYSLAPDPTVDYYGDVLGPDANCVNLLPNETAKVAGYDVSQVGVAFIAFDPRRTWPAEKKKRAEEFMSPSGVVVTVDADKAIPYLSLHAGSHLMFEINYIVEDVTTALGQKVSIAASASAFRSEFRKYFSDPSVNVIPYSKEGISEDLVEFMDLLLGAWREGAQRFAKTEDIPAPAADRMICGSVETYLMEAQMNPKEVLVQATKNHATPGGFLEMALKTFGSGGYDYIETQLKKWLSGEKDKEVYGEIEKISFGVARAISEHGKTVSGVKK